DRRWRAPTADRLAADLRAAGRRPFVIGVGGTGSVGAAGQLLAGLEAADQLDAARVGEATVVLPSATGGTHAGVQAGLEIAGRATGPVEGFAVAAPAAELRPAVLDLLDGLSAL